MKSTVPDLTGSTIRCLPKRSRRPIRALENPQTPSDAPRTWASGPVPQWSRRRLKAAGVRVLYSPDRHGRTLFT